MEPLANFITKQTGRHRFIIDPLAMLTSRYGEEVARFVTYDPDMKMHGRQYWRIHGGGYDGSTDMQEILVNEFCLPILNRESYYIPDQPVVGWDAVCGINYTEWRDGAHNGKPLCFSRRRDEY